ncbi:MAG: DUF222 domain-containing protein, partial [Actinomycetota bacterium]|nr:DUF222 domain-containing protein [Actinomycetota bacterium]
MSELAPPASPSTRRRQRLELVRRRQEQISILVTQQRLELAALASEDLAGLTQRYVPDELALVLGLSVRQARNRLDGARCFADFPAVHARIADGSWLSEHADAVLDELVGSGLDHAQQQQVLDLVLARKGGRTPHELRTSVRTATVVLFPEHALDRAEKARTDRDVRSYVEAPGVASLHACGPAADIAAMMACLDTMSFPAAPEDPRTVAQRRFDTLKALVSGQLQPGSWQAIVLVGLATVEGHDELPAEIPGFGPIPATQAREIIADGATLRRVVVDEHGQLVAVDDRVHRPDLPPYQPPHTAPRPTPEPSDGDVGGASHGGPAQGHDPVEHEPDPHAPSRDDLDWYDDTTDRTSIYARLDALVTPAADTATQCPTIAPQPPQHLSWQWSDAALSKALKRIRSDPIRYLD